MSNFNQLSRCTTNAIFAEFSFVMLTESILDFILSLTLHRNWQRRYDRVRFGVALPFAIAPMRVHTTLCYIMQFTTSIWISNTIWWLSSTYPLCRTLILTWLKMKQILRSTLAERRTVFNSDSTTMFIDPRIRKINFLLRHCVCECECRLKKFPRNQLALADLGYRLTSSAHYTAHSQFSRFWWKTKLCHYCSLCPSLSRSMSVFYFVFHCVM